MNPPRVSAHRVQGIAAIVGGLSVLIGAFGAHGLEDVLGSEQLEWYHTAVTYQFWHVVALWLAGDAMRTGRTGGAPALCFGIGIVLFSGSLYAMALTDLRFFAMITPAGGLSFILGWALLARGMLHGRS